MLKITFFNFLDVLNFIIVLLATTRKTYIGSVLFRTSAYTGVKQASSVLPFFQRYNNSPHTDILPVSFFWTWYVVHAWTTGPYECFETQKFSINAVIILKLS